MKVISYSYPFTWGLLLGLILMVMVWRLSRKDVKMHRTELKRVLEENKELQGHLNTQLKISGAGSNLLETQLEDQRKQNETLRTNLNNVMQKPGRAELRQLEVMEIAVRSMREQAPGFAQAWEKALRDAESHQEAGEGGLKKLMRRVVPNLKSLPSPKQKIAKPEIDKDVEEV